MLSHRLYAGTMWMEIAENEMAGLDPVADRGGDNG
jgi:hypothetical protein